MKKALRTFIWKIFKQPNIRFMFILTFLVIFLSTGLLSTNIIKKTYEFSIGDVATEDIHVPGDIQYKIDSETNMVKKRVSEMVPLVFDRDQSVLLGRLKYIETLFNLIIEILNESPPIGTDDRTFQLIALKSKLSKQYRYNDRILLILLQQENPKELRKIINRILIYILDRGILNKPYSNPLNIENSNATIRKIYISEETNEISKPLRDIRTINEIRKDLYKICYSIAPNISAVDMHAVYNIVKRNLRANLNFNIEETRRRIDEKVKSVKPVMGVLKKGQTLVREGDVITTETLLKINVLNKHSSSTNINYIIGIFLLQFIFFMVPGYFLMDRYSSFVTDSKPVIIIFSLIIFFILYTYFISREDSILNSNFIFALLLPIPFVTMIVAILYNIFIAMSIGMYLIFFSIVISGISIEMIVIAVSSAILGIFVIGDVKKRTDFIRGGLLLGFINSIIVTAVGLIVEFNFYTILENIELSFANGIINSILVLGIFPIYENIFGITTKFKLLELSDLNAPIFKKMLIDAPGTYNHSMLVANMSEAASEAIGANSLLAKVGGYYHDIGKIEDSEFYIENRMKNIKIKNLPPDKYCELIITHVEKGVTLAKKEKLAESVIDFIREHHGESTMTFFYHQALEQAENTNSTPDFDKSNFKYPGPKPKTRETAVVMLADSVEAASRSLESPTIIKLEGLIKKIIYNKLNEGELDYCDLTMSDLNKIQKAMMTILQGVFHTRIEYPEDEEVKQIEDRVMNSGNENKDI
ncbi:MAG: HDIG domain-containing protein [Spirochaetota bacterium]|nr:HDIG domain-containing protein [Spirochaetota bacterium]